MIEDGRLGTDNLSQLMTTGLTSGHFNLTRLAARFPDVVAAGELHAYVTFAAFESALAHCSTDNLQRGMANVLDMLVEIGSQLGLGIQNAASRSFLESITGANKTARAAKQLLALETEFDASDCLSMAMQRRMDRLKVWAARL